MIYSNLVKHLYFFSSSIGFFIILEKNLNSTFFDDALSNGFYGVFLRRHFLKFLIKLYSMQFLINNLNGIIYLYYYPFSKLSLIKSFSFFKSLSSFPTFIHFNKFIFTFSRFSFITNALVTTCIYCNFLKILKSVILKFLLMLSFRNSLK